MANNSEALQRIESYFDEFCKGVKDCLTTQLFVRGDLLDAYSRLARLRDRFRAEKNNLNPSALAALSKVFENDTFIKGMMHIRQVGEHVKRRGVDDLVIWTTGNAPITLSAETSAMSMFSAFCVTVTDNLGKPHPLNHLQMLQEAEKRITKAMSKTK